MQKATIQKATTKGQITLPIAWREKFKTNQFILKLFDNKLEIMPVDLDRLSEYTVFDGKRDNKGKGVPIDDRTYKF